MFPKQTDKWHARLPGARKTEHYNDMARNLGEPLGPNKFKRDWVAPVKLVAPTPLTSARLIDL